MTCRRRDELSSLLLQVNMSLFMTHLRCIEPARVHAKSWFGQDPINKWKNCYMKSNVSLVIQGVHFCLQQLLTCMNVGTKQYSVQNKNKWHSSSCFAHQNAEFSWKRVCQWEQKIKMAFLKDFSGLRTSRISNSSQSYQS